MFHFETGGGASKNHFDFGVPGFESGKLALREFSFAGSADLLIARHVKTTACCRSQFDAP
jgi:hypothetical protein